VEVLGRAAGGSGLGGVLLGRPEVGHGAGERSTPVEPRG
jgi:hypothetical protein